MEKFIPLHHLEDISLNNALQTLFTKLNNLIHLAQQVTKIFLAALAL